MDDNHQNKTESKQIATEDKSKLPLFSPEDEKEAQKEFDYLRKRLRANEKGAVNVTRKRSGFEDKTLWDKLNLFGTLAIPVILALATIGFGLWQAHLADLQHQNDIQIANDQQQEATLKAYLDDMMTLVLDKKLGSQAVVDQAASAEVVAIARAKTLTVLRRLTDPQRKALVVQFLYDAKLIIYIPNLIGYSYSIIDLSGADLSGVNLSRVVLGGAILSGADLSGANLSGVVLSGTLNYDNLSGANLSGAILTGTDLSNDNLSGADLSGAALNDADLSGATNLTQRQLDQVYSCRLASLPPGLTCHH